MTTICRLLHRLHQALTVTASHVLSYGERAPGRAEAQTASSQQVRDSECLVRAAEQRNTLLTSWAASEGMSVPEYREHLHDVWIRLGRPNA